MARSGNLEIVDLRDVGTTEERVLLRAHGTAKLSDYLIVNTKLNDADKLDVLNDHVFWFSSGVTVQPGEMIRLYTRKTGVYKTHISKYGDEDVRYHDFFWGLGRPVWDITKSDTITLFQINTWSSYTKRR